MTNAKLKVVLTAVLLAFAILPALIVGLVGTFSILNFEHSAKEDTLKTVSRSKATAVERLLSHYTNTVGSAAKSQLVIKAASNADESAGSLLQSMKDANPDFVDVLIIDENGTVIDSVKDENSAFQYFSSEAANPVDAVSNVINWVGFDGKAFYVSAEILEGENANGSRCGYICAVISLNPDSGMVKALSGNFLDGGRMIFFDSEGNIINFAGDGNVAMKGSSGDTAFDNSLTAMRESTLQATGDNLSIGTQQLVPGSAGRYTYVCGAIPTIQKWRWAGIVETGKLNSDSLIPIVIGWAVVVVCGALASLMALVITNRFIGTIHDMLKTMDAISEEEKGSAIRFKVKSGKSELGRIKSSFNEMLDEVILSEERHRTIAELSDNMLIEWDFHKERMFVSANALAKFDINTENATLSNGKFIDSLMSPEDAERYKRDINQLLRDKKGYNSEYQLKAKSGAIIWISMRAVCITDRLGEPLRVIGVMSDIDNEKKMELQLAERASFDFLSQLYNRNTFIRTLTQELERRNNRKLAILFIDVDDFKFINDRYGHTIGDEVIRYVADTIRTKVDNKGGFAGRFGGDEFVLCFTDQEDIENIENISMDIINELYVGHNTNDGRIINVKASIGIALCPEHSEDVNDLLSFSDTAMYFVKKNGKTNYHVYTPEDSENEEYIDPEF